jgi:hypothetical protein
MYISIKRLHSTFERPEPLSTKTVLLPNLDFQPLKIEMPLSLRFYPQHPAL